MIYAVCILTSLAWFINRYVDKATPHGFGGWFVQVYLGAAIGVIPALLLTTAARLLDFY
ncbi:MAG: hypothetical protein Kilf2KO_44450 [Rhodospirillales bacterium]